MLAGGLALSCLLAVPAEFKGGESDRRMWLGPDSWTVEVEDNVVRARSGYGESDVDLFIVGLSAEEATKKLEAVVRHVCAKLQRAGERPLVRRLL